MRSTIRASMRRTSNQLARAAALSRSFVPAAWESPDSILWPFSARIIPDSPYRLHSEVATGLRDTLASEGASTSQPAENVSAGERALSSESASSSQGKDLVAVFTCSKCDTRSAKAFSRATYERGVVLARCPGCQNLHLLSDQLGWFGRAGRTVEDFLADKGQEVRRKSETGTLEISEEDIMGWSAKAQS